MMSSGEHWRKQNSKIATLAYAAGLLAWIAEIP